MEGNQCTDVDVANPVAVGETEGLILIDVISHPLEPPAGHGAFAGIHQGDAPRLGLVLVHFHLIRGHVEGDIRHVQEVVGKVFLDQIALVAAADDELIHTMGGIELHDVPEDRLATDLDHGLGLEVGFLGDAGTEATGEDDGFHSLRLLKALIAGCRRQWLREAGADPKGGRPPGPAAERISRRRGSTWVWPSGGSRSRRSR